MRGHELATCFHHAVQTQNGILAALVSVAYLRCISNVPVYTIWVSHGNLESLTVPFIRVSRKYTIKYVESIDQPNSLPVKVYKDC